MKIILFICAAALFIFSGCLPVEEELPAPPIIKSKPVREYRTQPVARADVEFFRDVQARYRPAREEPLYFGKPGLFIRTLYVDVGDFVHKGDIIAELDRDYTLGEIEKKENERGLLLLRLAQLNERHEFDLMAASVTNDPVEDNLFTNERDSLLAQISYINERLDILHEEDDERVLRAGLDGMITQAMIWELGKLSDPKERVATVSDQTQIIFEAAGLTVDDFKPDQTVTLTIDWVPYEAAVIRDPEAAGITNTDENKVYFMLIGEDVPQLSSNSYGTYHHVTEQVKDALAIPQFALKKVKDIERTFVYVMENGFRTIRDIEVGLEGTRMVEVLGGLSEGEIIVIE